MTTNHTTEKRRRTPGRGERRGQLGAAGVALCLLLTACGSDAADESVTNDAATTAPAPSAATADSVPPSAAADAEIEVDADDSSDSTSVEPRSGAIRLTAVANFEIEGGTWTAAEGAETLGCDGGTFVDRALASGVQRTMTCEGREDDGTIVFDFNPEAGDDEGVFDSAWTAGPSEGEWAGLTGSGQWVATMYDTEDGADEEWTGTVELAPVSAADAATDGATEEDTTAETNEGGTASVLEQRLAALQVPDDAAGAITLAVFEQDLEPVVATSAPQAASIDDPVRIGGTSNLFTVVTALALVDDGALGLDDPIDQLITRVPVPDGVTVRHVLSQRVGFEEFVNDEFVDGLLADLDRAYTPEEVLGLVDTSTSSTEPGSSLMPTETTYLLLGVLIEEVTGRPFHEVVRAEILDPLEMTATHLPVFEDGDVFTEAYATFGEGDELTAFDGADTSIVTSAWSAGGYVSSATDLHRFLSALYGGEVLPPELVSLMTDGDEPIGMGLYRWDDEATVVSSFGGITGFSNIVLHEPATGITVYALSTDESLNIGGAIEPLVAELFPDLEPE